MIHKLAIVFAALILQFSAGFAQYTTTIPLNENVRYGKLQNGMSYYILHNEEPKDRASFYFVQNVGAILEEDNQNGLAHFLEHMAFNGTQNFPDKEIINYLERYGVKFGYNINAYTSQDETVYNISDVPVANSGLLDSCLLVLHDWSGYISLNENEIDSERGVIREEWRTRRNVRKRLMDQTSPFTYYGSKYARRDVIGDLDVINNFSHQTLRDYYHKWYRPDLQAVVVVGDLEVEELEHKVKTLFSGIPLQENAAPRLYEEIPNHKEALFCRAKDKEANSKEISLYYKKDIFKEKDEKYQRSNFVQSLYSSMLMNRFSELLQDTSAANLSMQAGFASLGRLRSAFYLRILPKENQTAKAFTQLMMEVERVNRYGFSASELERTKKEWLRSYESYYIERAKISNDQWAKKLQQYFLKAEPLTSIEVECETAKTIITQISLAEINTMAKTLLTSENRVMTVTGPEKEETEYLAEEDFDEIISQVSKANIEDYKDDAGENALISDSLVSGELTGHFQIKNTSAKGYVLSNGIRFILLPTDFNKDEISMNAFSFGGTSLLPQSDLVSADFAVALVGDSGLGEFSAIQLRKKLAGKLVSVSPYLGTYSEGMKATSSVVDLETMMQLVWLHFSQPRFDESAFENQRSYHQNLLTNMKADNSKAFQDSVSMSTTNHHPRVLLFNEKFMEGMDFEKVQAIYRDRFANAGDFTFVFVGNINEKKALPLLKKYLGSLTTKASHEKFVNHDIRAPKGKFENAFVREMETPKATVYYELNGEMPYTAKNRLMVKMICELLNKRYLETVRESEGGSYGVSVRPSISKIPYENFKIKISFDCDPQKEERLSAIIIQQMDQLVKQGPVSTDLESIRQNMLKKRSENEITNRFWQGNLVHSLMSGEEIMTGEEYCKMLEGVTDKQVQKFAKKIFKIADVVKVTMTPEKK
ncbi:MAG: insulinase family protein [Marinifilaceae bacterium]|nr:insulinase family protein [Marinifilaceae bacterium]